ncbi:MAG: hypothetical protein SGI92_23475 [Bryobacteraceae bacterium]|nr:hypothetical protein [Bryobacteraceae bacterium]
MGSRITGRIAPQVVGTAAVADSKIRMARRRMPSRAATRVATSRMGEGASVAPGLESAHGERPAASGSQGKDSDSADPDYEYRGDPACARSIRDGDFQNDLWGDRLHGSGRDGWRCCGKDREGYQWRYCHDGEECAGCHVAGVRRRPTQQLQPNGAASPRNVPCQRKWTRLLATDFM